MGISTECDLLNVGSSRDMHRAWAERPDANCEQELLLVPQAQDRVHWRGRLRLR